MLNHITVAGRLTKAPELKSTPQGVSVVSFSIACERDFSSNGTRDVDFINIVAWRGTAEFVSKYFNKGDMIIIDGRLQVRDWKDNNNGNHTIAEIVASSCYFGGSKRDSGSASGGTNDFVEAEDDGDLPF